MEVISQEIERSLDDCSLGQRSGSDSMTAIRRRGEVGIQVSVKDLSRGFAHVGTFNLTPAVSPTHPAVVLPGLLF